MSSEAVSSQPVDELFTVLSHPVRRWLLQNLPTDASVRIDELADDRGDGTLSDLEPDPRRLKISLLHVHLPCLERAGLIEAEARYRTVSLRADATAVLTPAVDALDDIASALRNAE